MAPFSRSRRALFGAPMAPGTPPIYDNGSSPDAGPITAYAATPTYKKPSTAQMIAGVLGDTISSIGGGQGIFLPQLMRQRQMQQSAAMEHQQRAAEFADWERKQRWERENPAPVNNDTTSDYDFISRTLGPEKAQEFLTNMVQNGGAAPQLMNVEGVGLVRVPRAAPATGNSTPGDPPAGALEMLRKNPALAPQFDQKYGQGASQRYLRGGPAATPGTFR